MNAGDRARALVHPDVARVRQYRGAATVDHGRVRDAMRRFRPGQPLRWGADPAEAPVRAYGPHDPETAPTAVTVLDRGRWPRALEVPLPAALVEQRRLINTTAHHRGAP